MIALIRFKSLYLFINFNIMSIGLSNEIEKLEK